MDLRYSLPFSLLMISIGGCSARNDGSAALCRSHECGTSQQALSSAVDLISAKNCVLKDGFLQNCVIPAQTLTFTPFESAVPLRTMVSAQITGTCPTKYPLQVSLSPDGGPAVTFQYYRGGQIAVRGNGVIPIQNLALTDASAWTRKAAFDPSCGMSLQFAPNVVDVNSKADAQAIIDQLTSDLAGKRATADNYHALLLYSQAYQFLFAIANHFYDDWTGDAMEKLRADAKTAKPALAQLITNCQNTPQQRLDLLHLYTALGTLGDPGSWTTDAGVKMTLADVLGPEDRKVLETIQQLTSQQGGDGGAPPDYDALYQAAEKDAATAQHKLDLAKTQLAAWLS
jgi:hypothetical protein